MNNQEFKNKIIENFDKELPEYDEEILTKLKKEYRLRNQNKIKKNSLLKKILIPICFILILVPSILLPILSLNNEKYYGENDVEREILADKFKAIESNNEFNDIFNDFKKNSPITLTDELVTITDIKNDMGEYEVYIVNIGSFSGNMEQIEEFLKYAEKYPKMVRVDNISFRKHEITGNISGSLKLSFYFKKLVEE